MKVVSLFLLSFYAHMVGAIAGRRRHPTNAKAMATKAFWTPERIASIVAEDEADDQTMEESISIPVDDLVEKGATNEQTAAGIDRRNLARVNNAASMRSASSPRNLQILDDPWTAGGLVQHAVGRIRMTKEGNPKVCSGTVVSEPYTDRTVILTAAHCVFDINNGVFADNFVFIPNQDNTTGTNTDSNCVSKALANR